MGKIRKPLPVKLFIGMLSSEPSLFDACSQILVEEYGPLDHESEVWPWCNSDYYQDEMGAGILRKFVFFERLIDPGELPVVKTFANKLEHTYGVAAGHGVRRKINLDPGYVTEAKVVLATTKDFSHRIYIGAGLFAEVTLQYSLRGRCFMPLEYTYSDYRSEEYQKMFLAARGLLRAALQSRTSGVQADIPQAG
jgi:hypothetical protein